MLQPSSALTTRARHPHKGLRSVRASPVVPRFRQYRIPFAWRTYRTHGRCSRPDDTPPVRPDDAAGRMVGPAARRLHDPRCLRRLRHVGRLPERILHLRTVSLSLLRPRAVRRLAPRVVRSEARLVAGLASLLPGAADPSLPGTVPLHLLLLSGRILQGILGGPPDVRRR